MKRAREIEPIEVTEFDAGGGWHLGASENS